eukprot:5517095-Prymnesium_polylepis.1
MGRGGGAARRSAQRGRVVHGGGGASAKLQAATGRRMAARPGWAALLVARRLRENPVQREREGIKRPERSGP